MLERSHEAFRRLGSGPYPSADIPNGGCIGDDGFLQQFAVAHANLIDRMLRSVSSAIVPRICRLDDTSS